MTDTISSLTVILDGNYRDDDAEEIVNAISMIRGVNNVITNISEPFAEAVARSRFETELIPKLLEVVRGPNG